VVVKVAPVVNVVVLTAEVEENEDDVAKEDDLLILKHV
jgi:hypothetical protein